MLQKGLFQAQLPQKLQRILAIWHRQSVGGVLIVHAKFHINAAILAAARLETGIFAAF